MAIGTRSVNTDHIRRAMLWQWNEWNVDLEQWRSIKDEDLPNCTRFDGITLDEMDRESNWTDFNLVYIKAEKCGGTTVSGVVRGIGDRLKMTGSFSSQWITSEPMVWATHSTYFQLHSKIERLQKPIFLMSWIREPAERVLSAFYHFKASRKGHSTSTEHILSVLAANDHELNFNHLTDYISMNQSVAEIMANYDFIGVQSRFTESMLVLAHRLGLRIEDMLYVKAKDSHGLKVDNRGFTLIPSVPVAKQSERVRAYLEGEWREHNAADYALWDAVNAELDRQIEGIPHFEESLNRYECLLEQTQFKCGDLPNHKADCYLNDQGCGIQCIRSVAERNSL